MSRQFSRPASRDRKLDPDSSAALEPLKAQVARLEQERDEAKLASADGFRQVQALEKKLGEVSNFLSGWRNGNKMADA